MSEAGRCPDEAALWRFFDGDGTDAELDAVGRHQEGCAACREKLAAFVSDDSWDDEAQAGGEERVVAALAEAGYEVVGKLGQGGMGVVYRARDRRLKRVVAVKLIALASPGRDLLARFRREAEAVARLQHPHIVQIHGVAECGGTPFLTLEYCSGGSLKKRLGGTPLPAKEAAEVVRQVALGVQAAHDQQVIHRDLKPANVLLAADGTPKVADFGLAKKLDEVGESLSGGSPMGTPAYMAPEQAQVRRDVGPLADVYALGAILYECLTGRPPFTADSVPEILNLVLTRDPVPPRQLNPSVARDLETVCLACLRKEPGRRYPTAADVAADLQRFLAGEPIVARRTGWPERAAKWARRHPAYAALAATVAAAAVLVAWSGYAAWRAQVSSYEARIDSQVARVETSQRLALEAGSGREVLRLLDKATTEGVPLTPQMKLDRVRALMMISQRKDALAAVQVVDRAALTPKSRAVADLLEGVLWLGDDEAKFRAKLRDALAQPDLPADERHYATGMLAPTVAECRQAFAAAVEANPRHIDARGMLAFCYVMLGRMPESIQLARESRLLAPEHSNFPAVLAFAYAFQGDRPAAVAQSRELARLIDNPGQAEFFEVAISVVAKLMALMQLEQPIGAAPVEPNPLELLKFVRAAPGLGQSLALPPGLRNGFTTWIKELYVGLLTMAPGTAPPEILLFHLVFPDAKQHTVLTFADLSGDAAARARLQEYPEGTLKYLYAHSLQDCATKLGKKARGTEASRDLWAKAAAAFEEAATTPGLMGHQGDAAMHAVLMYVGAGRPEGDHPGRPHLIEKARALIQARRGAGKRLPVYAIYYAVDVLVTAHDRENAVSLLAEWDTDPRVDRSPAYYQERAAFLHRLGLNEACLQALARIPSRVRLPAKERAAIAALRQAAEARLRASLPGDDSPTTSGDRHHRP